MSVAAPPHVNPAVGAARVEPARGILLSVFCVWAAGVEPLSFALVASAALPRIIAYGAPAVALLVSRLLTTGVGVAAARAVWSRRAGAGAFALVWLGLSAGMQVLTFVTPYFPGNRPPSTKWWELVGLIALHALWMAYLIASPHARRYLGPTGAGAGTERFLDSPPQLQR